MAAGVALALLFLRRQARLEDPLIDLALFRSRSLNTALCINMLGVFFMFGSFILLAQYFQLVAGLTPLDAGLWSTPSAIVFMIGSFATPALARRITPVNLLAGGLIVAAAGFVGLALAGGFYGVLLSSLLLVGFTPVIALTTEIIVTSAPPERAGAASALSETAIELGGALGIAALGSLGTLIYRAKMADVVAGLPADVARAAGATLGGAADAVKFLPAEAGRADALRRARRLLRRFSGDRLVGRLGACRRRVRDEDCAQASASSVGGGLRRKAEFGPGVARRPSCACHGARRALASSAFCCFLRLGDFMRLASYNVENLFDRARAMNLKSLSQGKPILERFAELNALLAQPSYSAADKTRMAKLVIELDLEKSDIGDFVILRRNRGGLIKRPKSGGVQIVASGRADWVGSLELRDEPVDEQAMRNTARVMRDIEADVLGVVEVESRPVLRDFNADVVAALGGEAFRHAMVIDGNDTRGIDVGLLTRQGFPIGVLRSHVDDMLTERIRSFRATAPSSR